ncbi:MAG: quinolinate synthase NadA [Clostridiales bacterium]|nr:quinolinate synthase NadA [Clostridiales bacterium]
MVNEIKRLKREKRAIILAHNYQMPEVQDIADFVGDSLELSKKAAATNADIIIFCGVHFMAESAKVFSPDKKVLLPVYDAGCPMADMIDADQLRELKKQYPNIPVVCYINSSAEVKAESDICCTSANAVKVVKSLDSDKVLFIPDQNLGSYVANQIPDKEIINWEGYCITHHRVKCDELDEVKKNWNKIKILVHPECKADVVEKADFVGSTSQIINYVNKSDEKEFVIGTEMGVLHSLKKENPDKEFYLLSPSLICHNMKKTRLKDVYRALKDEVYEIKVEKEIMAVAKEALEKMLNLS